MTIACAGHPPPLLLRGRQVTVLPVDATMPVLMMDLPKVPDVRHALQGGDRLLFYTDGVTERHESRRRHVRSAAPRSPRSSAAAERAPADQVLALVKDLDAFAAEREPDDDQTLLLIAIEEQGKVVKSDFTLSSISLSRRSRRDPRHRGPRHGTGDRGRGR